MKLKNKKARSRETPGLLVFWIGNIFLVILNIPLIGMWVRMLSIPYRMVFPAVVLFTCIGVYSTHNSSFDVWVLLASGIVGYFMVLLRLEVVPVLLGMILGPMLEEYFRRTLLLSRGSFSVFVERPITAVALGVCASLLIWSDQASAFTNIAMHSSAPAPFRQAAGAAARAPARILP